MPLRRLSLGVALGLTCVALPSNAHASGVTTHAYMAEAAIPFVENAQLRDLLTAHADEVIAGAHYPDGGYVAGGYGEVSHWERFVNAYTKTLRDRADCAPLTDPSGPCAPQIAHLMGNAGHGIGDERWDWLFEPQIADNGETAVSPVYNTGLPGSAELASLPPGSLINNPEFALDMIGLVEYDRFRKVPTYLPPVDDLLPTYKALGRDDITEEGIMQGHAAITVAAAGEREAVSTEYARVKLTLPKTAAAYETGSGGILDVAQAAAGYYDAVWTKLTTGEHPAPVVIGVHPLPNETGIPTSWHPVKASPGPIGGGSENRILASFSQSLDVSTITPESFRLLDPDGNVMASEPDFPRPGPYGAGDGTHTFLLWPRDDLQPCATYTAEVTPALKDYAGAGLEQPFRWSFTTRSADGAACPKAEVDPPPPVVPSDPPAPSPQPQPQPAEAPATPMGGQPVETIASPDGHDHGVPKTSLLAVRSLARTRGKGDKLRVLVSCVGPGDCRGRVALVATAGARTINVGSMRSYAVKALKSQELRFTLSRELRRELARRGRLELEVRLRQDAEKAGKPGSSTSRRFVLRQTRTTRRP